MPIENNKVYQLNHEQPTALFPVRGGTDKAMGYIALRMGTMSSIQKQESFTFHNAPNLC